MEPVGDVPHLDHLGHAQSMSHVWHMVKRAR
jgi:hypothetical protein